MSKVPTDNDLARAAYEPLIEAYEAVFAIAVAHAPDPMQVKAEALRTIATHAVNCDGGYNDGSGELFDYTECPLCRLARVYLRVEDE